MGGSAKDLAVPDSFKQNRDNRKRKTRDKAA